MDGGQHRLTGQGDEARRGVGEGAKGGAATGR